MIKYNYKHSIVSRNTQQHHSIKFTNITTCSECRCHGDNGNNFEFFFPKLTADKF